MDAACQEIEAQIAMPQAKLVLGSDSGPSSELLANVIGCNTCQEMLDLPYNELALQ